MSAFYSKEELLSFGFDSVGEDVHVSRLTQLYSVSGYIGDGTRIDDFTILKGHVEIGKKVHICSHCSLSGVGGRIIIGDLCGIGVNNIFYTASDDMLKSALCGPLVETEHTALKYGDIKLGVGVALGGRVTVMPNTNVGDFCAVGMGALLIGDYAEASVYMSIKGKLKRVATRDVNLLKEYAAENIPVR